MTDVSAMCDLMKMPTKTDEARERKRARAKASYAVNRDALATKSRERYRAMTDEQKKQRIAVQAAYLATLSDDKRRENNAKATARRQAMPEVQVTGYRETQKSRSARKGGVSHTYAVEAVSIGVVKIGRSRDVLHRLLQLRVASPVPLRLIAYLPHDAEAVLHRSLDEEWAHGEWFNLSDKTKAVIAALMQEVDEGAYRRLFPGSRTGRPRGRYVKRNARRITSAHLCRRCGISGHNAVTCRAGEQLKIL